LTKRSDVYTTLGQECGRFGHRHPTVKQAGRCLEGYQRREYSDRMVVAVAANAAWPPTEGRDVAPLAPRNASQAWRFGPSPRSMSLRRRTHFVAVLRRRLLATGPRLDLVLERSAAIPGTHGLDGIPRAPDQATTTYVSALRAGDGLKTVEPLQNFLHHRGHVRRRGSRAVDRPPRRCAEHRRSRFLA